MSDVIYNPKVKAELKKQEEAAWKKQREEDISREEVAKSRGWKTVSLEQAGKDIESKRAWDVLHPKPQPGEAWQSPTGSLIPGGSAPMPLPELSGPAPLPAPVQPTETKPQEIGFEGDVKQPEVPKEEALPSLPSISIKNYTPPPVEKVPTPGLPTLPIGQTQYNTLPENEIRKREREDKPPTKRTPADNEWALIINGDMRNVDSILSASPTDRSKQGIEKLKLKREIENHIQETYRDLFKSTNEITWTNWQRLRPEHKDFFKKTLIKKDYEDLLAKVNAYDPVGSYKARTEQYNTPRLTLPNREDIRYELNTSAIDEYSDRQLNFRYESPQETGKYFWGLAEIAIMKVTEQPQFKGPWEELKSALLSPDKSSMSVERFKQLTNWAEQSFLPDIWAIRGIIQSELPEWDPGKDQTPGAGYYQSIYDSKKFKELEAKAFISISTNNIQSRHLKEKHNKLKEAGEFDKLYNSEINTAVDSYRKAILIPALTPEEKDIIVGNLIGQISKTFDSACKAKSTDPKAYVASYEEAAKLWKTLLPDDIKEVVRTTPTTKNIHSLFRLFNETIQTGFEEKLKTLQVFGIEHVREYADMYGTNEGIAAEKVKNIIASGLFPSKTEESPYWKMWKGDEPINREHLLSMGVEYKENAMKYLKFRQNIEDINAQLGTNIHHKASMVLPTWDAITSEIEIDTIVIKRLGKSLVDELKLNWNEKLKQLPRDQRVLLRHNLYNEMVQNPTHEKLLRTFRYSGDDEGTYSGFAGKSYRNMMYDDIKEIPIMKFYLQAMRGRGKKDYPQMEWAAARIAKDEPWILWTYNAIRKSAGYPSMEEELEAAKLFPWESDLRKGIITSEWTEKQIIAASEEIEKSGFRTSKFHEELKADGNRFLKTAGFPIQIK